jgi:hypothetical protein
MASTRAFSVTTWRTRRSSGRGQARDVLLARGAQRGDAELVAGRLALGRRSL